jgi:hypothetical protein
VTNQLRPEVRQVLATEVDSFEKLEVLSRVFSATTGLDVNDPALDNEVMASAVAELSRDRLIEERASVYVIGVRGIRPAVAELMMIHEVDRMLVVSELSSLAIERIRSMTSNAFANAFVLRKKRGDDG